MSLTIIRAEYNKDLMDLLYALDRENKEDKGYKARLYGFTGTSEGDKTICSASPISSNYSMGKHTVFALDNEPISNIVLPGDYTGLGLTRLRNMVHIELPRNREQRNRTSLS